jgi:hypothetical protein
VIDQCGKHSFLGQTGSLIAKSRYLLLSSMVIWCMSPGFPGLYLGFPLSDELIKPIKKHSVQGKAEHAQFAEGLARCESW